MNIRLDANDECLCQSGMKLQDCCGATGQLFRKPIEIKLLGSKTGYAHPHCYANSLNDCSTKISKEHIFSENILKKMGGQFTASGLAWMKNKEMKLTAASLAANVLCERHNTALSPLDSSVGQFFQELSAAEEYLVRATKGKRYRLFNGNDMERWLLKVALGLAAANWVEDSSGGQKIKNADYWVKTLFSGSPFPDRFGLYAYAEIGYETKALNSVSAGFASNTTDGIYGLEFVMISKKFILPLMLFSDSFNPGSVLATSIYHPGEFIINKKGKVKLDLIFSWDRPSHKSIVMEYHNDAIN